MEVFIMNEKDMGMTTAQMDRLFDCAPSMFDGVANMFERSAQAVNRISDAIAPVDTSSRRNTGGIPSWNPNQYGYGNNPTPQPAPVQYGYGYGTNSNYSSFGFGSYQSGISSLYDHPMDGFWNPSYGMGSY
jgi:hypothetical protein